MSNSLKTASLIIIGDEILSGRVQDLNLQYLAKWLNEQGVELKTSHIIPDDEEIIISTLNTARKMFDFVFTTGGIGPTHDDITSEAVAKSFGVGMELREDAVALLEKHYPNNKISISGLKMATLPIGAEMIPNSVSVAPGFRMDNVYVMAGIPKIMQAMLVALRGKVKGTSPIISKAVTAQISEGKMALALGVIQDKYFKTSIGSYPFFNNSQDFGTTLVVRSRDEAIIAGAMAEIKKWLDKNAVKYKDGERK
ncbi:MAG: competence/damage-inducible protein A [Sphingomonadales bacterium]